MKATFQISEDDYVAAMNLYFRVQVKVVLVMVIVLLILAVLAMLAPPQDRSLLFAVLAGAVVAVVLGRWVLSPFVARKHYRKYKAIQDPITIALQDEGIKFANTDGAGLIRWSKILKWRQNERFLLVYVMPRLYYIVPKSVGNDDFDISVLAKALEARVGAET
ncbi:MAG: YcxB family protein [Gammaproteobacteria bacterium]|nr:YcxB family protein [Gammaproteobacteria bacterium]